MDTATVAPTSTSNSAKVLSRSFDQLYQRLVSQDKTCNLLLERDLFEGKLYTPDEFYSFSKQYFDKPTEFFKTFKDVSAVNFRPGVHPAQGNWKRYKHPAKAMLFDTPLESNYEVNNLVPFRWFTNEHQKSDTIILFVPGWGRESQSNEENACAHLQQLGVDVGLVTKPYHQARTPKGAHSGEYFISANLYWTVQNFRQLVAELRLLIQYMRQHYKRVGLFGMSSGGFQSCLAANCEEVDFLFPFMTGCNLWNITWNGMLTTHVKKDFIAKGLTEDDVRKAWSICDEGVLAHNCKAKVRKHYITLYDQVIQPENQFALWEALGRNQKMEMHVAHYSAAAFMFRKIMMDVASVVKGRVS